MLRLVHRWRGYRGEEPGLKRILYFCALACLVGAGWFALQISEMPSRVGDALQEVADHDPEAKMDVELAKEPNAELNEYVLEVVGCLVGFATCTTLAKRAI